MKYFLKKGRVEAGCDEVGRGCLAGPVVAAAVMLKEGTRFRGLNDSKKLSKKDRDRLTLQIRQKAAAYAIGVVSPAEIDEINILNASYLAMHRALDQLQGFQHILVDGNRFNAYRDIEHTCVVKGDGKYAAIAAASVLAKTYRDEWMACLAKDHPEYGWETNVGYPTPSHREAIRTAGVTAHHRRSFQLLPAQLALFES